MKNDPWSDEISINAREIVGLIAFAALVVAGVAFLILAYKRQAAYEAACLSTYSQRQWTGEDIDCTPPPDEPL